MKKNRVFQDTFFKKNFAGLLLKPFTWLYSLGVGFRNVLYNKDILSSRSSDQYSIVVGNLTVGGTGKTPLIEYLITCLKNDFLLVTLSRGYGRKSRGFQLATPQSTSDEIGDEPLQYYEKFGKSCPVAVCENRVKGSLILKNLFPEHRLLLLDDAFQHRALRPDLSILLNDYTRPFYEDEPFPGGRLRESRRGAIRADAIITTKCPAILGDEEKAEIVKKIRRYAAREAPVFFASIGYGEVYTYENTVIPVQSVTLVAGIARPEPLIDYVGQKYHLSGVRLFPDHYAYTADDVEALLKLAKSEDLILTTEKDKVKLRPLARKAGVLHKFAFLPIRVDFGADTSRFETWLNQQINLPQISRGDR